jgi:hypothetical protein
VACSHSPRPAPGFRLPHPAAHHLPPLVKPERPGLPWNRRCTLDSRSNPFPLPSLLGAGEPEEARAAAQWAGDAEHVRGVPTQIRLQPWFCHWAWVVAASDLASFLNIPSLHSLSGEMLIDADDADMARLPGATRLSHSLRGMKKRRPSYSSPSARDFVPAESSLRRSRSPWICWRSSPARMRPRVRSSDSESAMVGTQGTGIAQTSVDSGGQDDAAQLSFRVQVCESGWPMRLVRRPLDSWFAAVRAWPAEAWSRRVLIDTLTCPSHCPTY